MVKVAGQVDCAWRERSVVDEAKRAAWLQVTSHCSVGSDLEPCDVPPAQSRSCLQQKQMGKSAKRGKQNEAAGVVETQCS
jgi:hypothetical protein